MELSGVAERVILERVGGLAGGGFLYQVIPIEMDANAAAAMFVRAFFGADRIDELLQNGSPDGAAFRSVVGPSQIASLPERTLLFLASVPDLCQLLADRSGIPFQTLLDVRWRGAGDIWERMVSAEELRVPR